MSWIPFRFTGFGCYIPLAASVVATGTLTLIIHQNIKLKDDLEYARYERDLLAQLYVSDKIVSGGDGGVRDVPEDPNLIGVVYNPPYKTSSDKSLRLEEQSWIMPRHGLIGGKDVWPVCKHGWSKYSVINKNEKIAEHVERSLAKHKQQKSC